MAILKILKDSDPALRKVSRTVDKITPRIIQLLDDMIDTMREANGAGLAAPQVGVLRRVALVEADEQGLIELINPEVVHSEGCQNELEGCLSVPDTWGITERPQTVTVRALNRRGETFEVTGSGLAARALCHEIDHLDGILFTDNALRILTTEELEELAEQQAEEGAAAEAATHTPEQAAKHTPKEGTNEI